jgi:hypothetical protein
VWSGTILLVTFFGELLKHLVSEMPILVNLESGNEKEKRQHFYLALTKDLTKYAWSKFMKDQGDIKIQSFSACFGRCYY